ncbi:hypothetical protein [Chroococcidiopsis sp. TS-821]|uniref:hypothetical protein n=1 Tax=Chroococcidiopsis sp. TS-821 TaxID=1378066 RepID=UPI001AEFC7D9|nr:hypothetical protein [Chroococcidiopsis sp. TS-821]
MGIVYLACEFIRERILWISINNDTNQTMSRTANQLSLQEFLNLPESDERF